jgi:hypothetical protein
MWRGEAFGKVAAPLHWAKTIRGFRRTCQPAENGTFMQKMIYLSRSF